MSLSPLVRDDELHIKTDAERARDHVLRSFHQPGALRPKAPKGMMAIDNIGGNDRG
jgi:hypothetical protein